jgi:hypothetical protein
MTDHMIIRERRETQMQPHAGLTVADVEAFLAERKAEAQRIDPANCEVYCRFGQVLDPYDLFDVPEEWRCVGRDWFVRNLPDGHWVWDGDLPEDIRHALASKLEADHSLF